jgi:hypothetical protein
MTTATERTTERATAERAAWRTYAASLRDLDGREYDEAEPRSWEHLQRRLGEIASRETPPAG